MNETSSKNEITSGIIWKQLLLFFFPILLGSFFQQLYNTIDAVIVGRFVGKNALAAVAGSSGMVINLLVNFFTGLTAGASVPVLRIRGPQKGGRQYSYDLCLLHHRQRHHDTDRHHCCPGASSTDEYAGRTDE